MSDSGWGYLETGTPDVTFGEVVAAIVIVLGIVALFVAWATVDVVELSGTVSSSVRGPWSP